MGAPIKLMGFSGLAPRTHKRLIAENQAQVATNARLTNGQVASLRDPLLTASPGVSGAISVYRALLNGAERWAAWAVDVDVARGPLAQDVLGRFYWTGDGEPRMSQFSDAFNGGGPYPSIFYVLGVFPPKTAPTVVPGGGAGVGNESRSYVYTFQTPFGEESGPSPASAVQTANNAAWALSNMDAAPPNTGTVSAAVKDTPVVGQTTVTLNSVFGLRAGEDVTFASVVGMTDLNAKFNLVSVDTALGKVVVTLATTQTYTSGGTWARKSLHNVTGMVKNIYRTVTGQSGATEWRFVDVVAVATTTYSDTKTTAVVALNNLLASTLYEQPPADMRGLIALANGMMAGISKNQVCLCAPFQPHAWPSAYRQTVSHNLIGLGYFGTTIVACTEGPPYTMTGVDPVTMGGGMQPVGVEWPCMSKRSVVSTPFGVMYAAPQGLALVGIGGPEIVTRPFYTQEEWAKVYPATMVGAMRDNKYYGSFTVDANFSYVLIVDKSEAAAITVANYKVSELWTDMLSGKLYAVQSDVIKEWDAAGGINSLYDWQSKEFVYLKPQNNGACKVDADFTQTADQVNGLIAAIAAAKAANQAIINSGPIGGAYGMYPIGQIPIGLSNMQAVPDATYNQLQFQLYVDGALKLTKQLTDSKAFRLPAGYMSDNVSARISGNVPVSSIKIAPTMKALELV